MNFDQGICLFCGIDTYIIVLQGFIFVLPKIRANVEPVLPKIRANVEPVLPKIRAYRLAKIQTSPELLRPFREKIMVLQFSTIQDKFGDFGKFL